MANMTPEERQQFIERMRARGFDPEAMTGGRGGSTGQPAAPSAAGSSQPAAGSSQRRQARPAAEPSVTARASGGATTIDALFGPLPPTESFGQAWLFQGGKLSRVSLRLGITDGQQTELIQGDLKEGQEVVTSVVTAAQRAATNAGSTAFPGFQQNRGGGFGGFQGGGNQRGGGAGGGARGGGR
jgi:HlyD family secretion protein